MREWNYRHDIAGVEHTGATDKRETSNIFHKKSSAVAGKARNASVISLTTNGFGKIWGSSLWTRSSILGLRSAKTELIVRVIVRCNRTYVTSVHQRYRLADRQTDRQHYDYRNVVCLSASLLYDFYSALCTRASRAKNRKTDYSYYVNQLSISFIIHIFPLTPCLNGIAAYGGQHRL